MVISGVGFLWAMLLIALDASRELRPEEVTQAAPWRWGCWCPAAKESLAPNKQVCWEDRGQGLLGRALAVAPGSN